MVFETSPRAVTSDSMSSFLLDTNVLSEAPRPQPNANVVERVALHQLEIVTAAPVWDELIYGYHTMPESTRRRILRSYLFDTLRPGLDILPFDRRAAEWHASERARLAAIGRTPPFIDGQIAAIAVVNDLILVTANTSDFVHFQDLRIEDWTT